jgi:hypothetical protein
MHDPLIEKVVEEKRPLYISQEPTIKSRYIAAIPAGHNQQIDALILIEEMPFMSFHKDNLAAISFVFEYFIQTLHKQQILKTMRILPEFEPDFRFEYFRLYHLAIKHEISSSILAFQTASELTIHRLNETIHSTFRQLDIYSSIYHNGIYMTLVLVPFSSVESSRVLQMRIYEKLIDTERDRLDYSLFDISQRKILKEFLGLGYVRLD